VVRTLWGELAYQLGGKKFKEYGPCLILIDE